MMAQPPKHDAEEFFPDTHFEHMARRPGGLPRDKALAAAQRQVDELKIGFIDWLDRQLKELASALAVFDVDPNDLSQLERADRICGEVRDVGTTVGYAVVTFVAMTLCEVLDSIRAGAVYEKKMIDCHVNALFYIVREQGNLTQEQIAELTDGLRRIAGIASISPGKDDN